MKTIFLIFLLFLTSCSYRVVRIIDGDTIVILDKFNRQVRIRLAGIDCPEHDQPFGQKAKQETAELCFNKTVRIEKIGKDHFGRTLAFVYVGEISVNKELLRAGLAWHYSYFDHSPELSGIEARARMKHLGLWREQNPLAPWMFRRNQITINN
jgi:endonuclease YncB( thermonuclease family)